MKQLILLIFIASTAVASAQMDVDSIPRPAGFTFSGILPGLATIGGGDSVTVSVPGVTSFEFILLSYKGAKLAEAANTTTLSWTMWADIPDQITIYGTNGKSVSYCIIR